MTRTALRSVSAASLFLFFSAAVASACPSHSNLDLMVPGIVGEFQTSARFASADATSNLAAVTAWKINFTGAKGTSTDSTINGYVSGTLADVQEVRFDNTYAYARITDVPSHAVGPFPGNPAYPAAQNRVVRIPRIPNVAATKTKTGNGPIGVMVNGVFFFNATDARSYNNAGYWNQNANVVEAASFDTGRGHPAPGMGGGGGGGLQAGTYHYHQNPAALLEQLDPGNTGQHHSPLLGFAVDGFPIYGPYGYVNATDATSGVKKLTSGYKIRDDVAAGNRNSLVDGTTVPTNQRGPAVNATYPAGYYVQDYEWASGIGDLNAFNMRFAVTPEYPDGTWAYFAGVNSADGGVAYPYLIGPEYYGVVDASAVNSAFSASAVTLKGGDATADGSVNFDDLLLLAQHYEVDGYTNWSGGDFDRDGVVGFSDLLLLAQNYTGGSALAMSEFALAQSLVPEPTMLAAGSACILLLRRQQR